MMSSEELCCAAAQFSALLNITLDVPGPTVSLGHIELTAVAGTARLHTNKEVFTLYLYFCLASMHRHTSHGWLGIAVFLAADIDVSKSPFCALRLHEKP